MPNRIGERDISYTNFTCVLQLNSLALSGKKKESPDQGGNSVSIFNFVKAPPSKFAETQANKALLFEIEKSKWVSILSDSGLKRLKGPNMSKLNINMQGTFLKHVLGNELFKDPSCNS